MEARILLLTALVAGALAGPITVRYANDNNMCSQKCTESSKFKYRPGMTYEFDYNVQTVTAMEGASEEQATLGLKAIAHVEIVSKCELALQLRNVQVFQSDPTTAMKPYESAEFRRALESYPLRFAFQDGVVEELCPDVDEQSWSLNIKRGVLTAFQNAMDTFDVDQSVHESDVTGKCVTDYKTSKNWYTTTISKSKDLLACMDRQDFRSILRTMPYRLPSDIQSLPLLKSEHHCTQEIDNSAAYLKSVLCKETHVFRPFSQQNNGAVTKIIQKLTYKNQRSGITTRQGTISRRANMMFEHTKTPVSSEMQKRDVERKLQEICQLTQNDIRPEVPVMFSELVYLMRNLDTASMKQIYRQVSSGSLCRSNTERTKKIFLDTIPMVSTASSVEMMKELLMNGEVSGLTAEMWLTTLAFIQSPTREMVVHAKSILQIKALQDTAMLPISSLVNNFCSKTEDCAEMPEVRDIIAIMENVLGRCYVTDRNLEKVLKTLRAIGNAGNSNTIGSTALNSCFSRTSNPMEVRVAALDAFRRLPCTADRSEPMTIFRDQSADSELRIAAYLAVMKCPTDGVLSMVKTTLESEDANQVGSFVWTHLTNLMETASPHKQAVRFILEDARLKSEFNMDKLKYSRNYEGSFMLDKINTGALVESNVIWSSKSFIPRSAMLNLTVDLFGNSVNLMEMGGRIEGLEYLLETYLGPLGYFGEKSTSKSLTKSKAKLDQLRGSMYMRLFGNEMAFAHFKGLDSLPKMDSFKSFDDMLRKLSKSHDYSFTQSVMFLDSSIIVPTSVGMPLNLTVNGVATVDMKASGKLNLNGLTSNPTRLQINGEFRPSGAVAITGCMTVDAIVTRSGLKMTSTVHTSTATKGQILVHGTKIISAEIDMPQDKMEILDVKSAFYIVHGNVEKEQRMITDNKKVASVCTGPKLSKITGLELCGEISFPNASMKTEAPYFPLTGPVGLSLILHKRDSHLGYRFLAKRSHNSRSSLVQIAIDTPGSSVDRSLAFDFILNSAAKDLEIKMVSPWKKASSKGSLIVKPDKYAFNGEINVDESPYLIMEAETKVLKSGKSVTYQPKILVSRPLSKLEADGKIIVADDIFLGDIEIRPSTAPVTNFKWMIKNQTGEKSLMGSVNYQNEGEYSALLKLLHESSKKSWKLIPSIEIKAPKKTLALIKVDSSYRTGKSLDIDASLAMESLMKKPISCSCQLKRIVRKNNQVKYQSDIVIQSKPITVKIDGNLLRRDGNTASRVTVDYSMPRSKKNKITFNSKYNDRSTKTLAKHTWNTNFEVKRNPEYNVDSSIDFSHNSRHTDGKVDIRVGDNKKHRLHLDSSVDHKGSLKAANIGLTGNVHIPLMGVNLQLKGTHKHNSNHLDSSINLGYGKGKALTSNLRLKDDSKKTTKRGGEFTISFPNVDIVVSSGLAQASKKELQHTLNLSYNKQKSSIVTVYKQPRHESHEVSTDINIDSFKPIRLSGETNLNMRNFKAAGQVDYNGDKYRIASISKYSPKDPRGKMTVEIIHPSREIVLTADGQKNGNKYSGSIETKWDAAKDRSKKISLDGMMNIKSINDVDGTVTLKYPERKLVLNLNHNGNKKYLSHVDFEWSPKDKIVGDLSFSHALDAAKRNIKSAVSLTTPFDMMPKVTADLEYTSDPEKYSSSSKLIWGRNQETISTNLSVKKPISLNHIDLSMRATSPFVGLRRVKADISHDVTDAITTVVKGIVEDTTAEVTVSRQNRNTYYKTDMEGGVTLKSNIPEFESVSLIGKLMKNNDKYQANVALNKNGDRYMSEVDMNLYVNGWQMQTRGDLVIATPMLRITNNWNHRNTDSDTKSSLTSEWSGKKLHLALSGLHELSAVRKLQGEATIQTPWELLRNIEISLNHQHASGFIASSAALKKNRNQIASSNINYRVSGNQGDMDVAITNPYTHDISGKVNFRAQAFPMTGHVEMEWSPRQSVAVDGTLTYDSPVTFDGSVRITTPFELVPSVLLKATNKHIEGRMLFTTANLEYGIRKRMELESRIRYDDNKEVQLKVRTAFSNVRAIDAQVSFAKAADMVDGKLELEILPLWGKFSTVANGKWASDITGKFRMDTPYPSFPYLQIEATSALDNTGRHSQIEAEYSPKQMISLHSTYTFAGPIAVDINLMTPFSYLENVGAIFKHDGKPKSMMSHAEIRYAPYKIIQGDWTMKWFDDISGVFVLKTPFSDYENSKIAFRHSGDLTDFKSHGEVAAFNKKIDSDVNFSSGRKTQGEIIFHSPFEGFEEIRAKAEMNGRQERFRMSASLNYGVSKEIQAILRNSYSRNSIKTTFTLQTPYTDNFKFTIDHDGELSRFTNKISSNLGRKYSVNTDTSFDLSLPTIDLTTVLDYRLPVDTRRVTINVHKDGEWDNSNGYITGECNGKEVSLRGNFQARNGIEGSVKLVSPFSEDISLTLNHNGELSHCTTKLSANMGSDYIISTDNTIHVDLPTIDISNYLTYRYAGEGREVSLLTHGDGSKQRMNGKITAIIDGAEYSTLGSLNINEPIEAVVTINTPIKDFREVSAALKHSGSLSAFDTSASVKYMDGKKIESTVNFFSNGLEKIEASAITTTPFENYERTEYKYNHNVDDSSINSHGEINYGYSKSIISDLHASLSDKLTARVSISTPFEGYKINKLVMSGKGSSADFQASGELEFAGEKMNVESSFSHADDTTGRFSVLATSPAIKDIIIDFSRNGNWNDFTCTGKAMIARESVAEGRVTGLFKNEINALTINFKNPYTEDIDAAFKHEGPIANCKTTIEASMGRDNTVFSKTIIATRSKAVEISSTNRYALAGEGDSISTVIKSEGDMKERSLTVSGSYAGKSVDGSVSYNLKKGLEVDASLSTPIASYRNLAFNLRHMGRPEKFNTKTSLRYMDGQEITASLNFYRYLWNTLKSSLRVTTPFSGMESTKVSYEHNAKNGGLSCSGNIEYGRGQEISTEVRLANEPKYSADITVKTPFTDYESISYTASAENRNSRYSGEASFKMGSYKTYTVNADLNMNDSPITGSLKMYTPVPMLKDVDVSFSHSGEWNNFRSYATLESTITGRVTGETTMVYTSPFVMDGFVILKSALPNMEELKLAVRNTKGDEHRYHAELGWKPTQMIVVDGGYKLSNGWYDKQYSGDISINTPFECLREFTMTSSSTKTNGKYTNKMEADYNGDTILDMESDLMTGNNKCEGGITMNKPRPVQFTWTGMYTDSEATANVFFNWNRDEANSNLRLIAESKLGSAINIKLVNPTRTVAMKGNYQTTGRQTRSQGEFAWDEQLGRKIFYDLEVSDNSRRYKQMYDASLKVGAPSRTLQMRGSYSDASNTKTLNTAFLWDADKDTSKQIGFKGNFIPSDKTHKADVVITLPNNRQDIRIGTEMTVDSGRTIFDGKTEFSYSPDSRKTLVLTSNLKDVSYERGHNNYSLSLGIRHPYTDTDVQITSHIGSTSNKYASGMQMQYLTASRRHINLALLGDIDRLRKQINLQAVSPINNIEVTGEVKSMSPYQVVVNSRVDGQPSGLAAMSIDTEAKSIHFESNYDIDDLSNMFHVEAKYVNSSSMKGEVYLNGGRINTQSLVTMTLENPRVLAAHISWKPEMMMDLKNYAAGQWRQINSKVGSSAVKVNEAIGEELVQKYRIIAEAVGEEVSPFIDMLVRELQDVESQLHRYTTQLRRMHYQDQFYMKSMGDTAERHFFSAIDSYRQAIVRFNTFYTSYTGSMSQLLDDLRSYPIKQQYEDLVSSIIYKYKMMLENIMESSVSVLEGADANLQSLINTYKEHSESLKQRVVDLPQLEMVRAKLSELGKIDYVGTLKNNIMSTVNNYNIGDKYNSIVYNTRELINTQLADVMNRGEVKYVQARVNDVYQQGKWAYAYWEVEETLQKNFKQLFALIKEIFEDEMKQYYNKFSFLNKSKLSVYEPEKGEIRAEIYLPLPLNNLEEMPETSAYIEEMTDLVADYIPSKSTLVKLYEDNFPSMYAESNNTSMIEKPSVRSMRQRRRRRPQ